MVLRRKSRKLASLTMASVMALGLITPFQGPAAKAAETGTDFEFTLMHTNDTHAHLDNIARRISAINAVRTEVKNSILLDAGDVFSGTLFFNQYSGQADLEFMNSVGYDAMVPGNHEFDKGPSVFADFIKKAKFPVVSSNIDFSKEPSMKDLVKNEIGQAAEDGKIYQAVTLDVNGEKVGVFGVTTEDVPGISSPGPNVVFEDATEKAAATVASLKDKGINKVIALSHLGYEEDLELGKAVQGIDVIVGGHTHTKLDKPVALNADKEPTIVVQANEYSKFLGRVDLTFTKDGILKAYDGKLIELDAKNAEGNYVIAEDPAAAERLKELAKPVEEMKKLVVGETTVDLDGVRANVRAGETNLGNLIGDAMLEKAAKFGGADILIHTGGGIRNSIPAGNITLAQVLDVMPYGNTVVTLELTGAEIKEALENGVSKYPELDGRFPHVAGMKFSFNPNLPVGSRVVDIQVKKGEGYVAIDPKATYSVATNNFLADGGDFYTVFKTAKDEGRIKELFFVDYELFNEYLAAHKPVNPQVEGRVTDISKNIPVVHKEPIARLILKKENPLYQLNENGIYTEAKDKNGKTLTVKPGAVRVYGFVGNYYNIGGNYYVIAENGKIAAYKGRILINGSADLYNPDGKVFRTLNNGEAIKVYGETEDRYLVGNGYYVLKAKNVVFYTGFAKILKNTKLVKDGNVARVLHKGEEYRVYDVNGDKLYVGGGYYIMANRGEVQFNKN